MPDINKIIEENKKLKEYGYILLPVFRPYRFDNILFFLLCGFPYIFFDIPDLYKS